MFSKKLFFGLCIIALAGFAVFVRCSYSAQEEKLYLVQRVIDGDTIEIEGGTRVRYSGVDAPEVRRRKGSEWVFDPEPYALKATQFNRELVEGRMVRLEFDAERRDRFGRLLAYIFLEDGLFVNRHLVREGLARTMTIPPNTRYTAGLEEAQRAAKKRGAGIWHQSVNVE